MSSNDRVQCLTKWSSAQDMAGLRIAIPYRATANHIPQFPARPASGAASQRREKAGIVFPSRNAGIATPFPSESASEADVVLQQPANMAPRTPQQALSRLALTPGSRPSLPLRPFRSLRPKTPSTTPTCPPRLDRPRPFSTSPPRPQEPNPLPAALPAAPARKPPFGARRLLHAALFLLIGTAAGASLRILITPPVPPAPGTPEDEYTTSVLHAQAASLPIVRQLTADPSFESWAAYQTLTPEHRAQHIMAGSLAGARGVGGYQRIWHNASTGEFVSVVFLGGAITGWPGVVHGGALATLLDESMARAAFRQWGGRSGVTANLQVEYKAMTLASGFYVVRLRARGEEELEERERGKRHYKSFVEASVEDAVTGRVTVVARGLFVGGQGGGKGGVEVEGGPRLAKVEENQKF